MNTATRRRRKKLSKRRPRSERDATKKTTKPPELICEPGWYKHAIIYQLHVRAFCDSNGDGIGDFPGLTSKLDYLADLGVTAIWLLPFYKSPLRDDGYDIADYRKVNPAYGTNADFRRFVSEAHRRGLAVITELVINHTSDQHAWFQKARRSPPGSPARNFYVWSDDPSRYNEARIIFQDYETSNWTYDPVAGQYYWHRFFHHQPDLNFDNPAVHEAVLSACDYWFNLGVDGMRLDAVPYLYERDDTNCENLPETHAFLKKLRAHVDEHHTNKMLLAEANQWPEDAARYFGDGDECHMAFHFPLMPRLFMALHSEDRHPIVDILAQTPSLPEPCQWAMFLRNHDELTLEMVTDEERDYMVRTYAQEPSMRINLGIRRRLAPLLENNRRKIELMNALLHSFPGTPVVYYGDEIGMGDNVYLGDRDGVRTPMQWSGDRNAGFSRANPQKLFLPVVIDPGFHYETTNVESQQANPSSQLWWTRRLISLRRSHSVMATGSLEFLQADNPKILAFLRRDEDETILVVANLSRFVQPVTLDLSEFESCRPRELSGHTKFPTIDNEPYFLTLAPHGFYWFSIESDVRTEIADDGQVQQIEISENAEDWFAGPSLRRWLQRRLPRELPKRRWYAAKSRSIRGISIDDIVQIECEGEGLIAAAVCLIRVEYIEAEDEVYAMPLALMDSERAYRQFGDTRNAVFAQVKETDERRPLLLCDAAMDESFWMSMRELVMERRKLSSRTGEISGILQSANHRRNGKRKKRRPSDSETPTASQADSFSVRLPGAEQSNNSAIFGGESIMKLFRRIEEGTNPDLEIASALTHHRHKKSARENGSQTTPNAPAFENTPAVIGAIEYRNRRGDGRPVTLAMLQEFVPNQGDAWSFTLDAVGRYFERVMAFPEQDRELKSDRVSPLERMSEQPDQREWQLINGYLSLIELLGRRTAEMHGALAFEQSVDFKPEPFSKLYQRALYQSMRNAVARPLQVLRASVKRLDGEVRTMAEQLLSRRDEMLDCLARVSNRRLDAMRIRCHGDYHLGQVLWTGEDFMIIDFEGEPMKPLSERRLKRACLLDVAGMLRSISYASQTGLRRLAQRGIALDTALRQSDGESGTTDSVRTSPQQWADYWCASAQTAFCRGYFQYIPDNLVPTDTEGIHVLLDGWLIVKGMYEVAYELNNRPDWVDIPLRGVIGQLDTQ